MRQVRWAGWTVAIATALALSGGQVVRADVKSDSPAAIVVYPDVEVNSSENLDTLIRLTNTNVSKPTLAWCFYVDANSHCSGGTFDGDNCTNDNTICTGGSCVPGWSETDFRINLTPNQPIQWLASKGLADDDLPLKSGRCRLNQFRSCGVDSDCTLFIPGDTCTQSNAGTRIPPVPEDSFLGELRCIEIDSNGVPLARNDLKGEALIETASTTDIDVASYNAIGIEATGNGPADPNILTIGPGSDGEYNGCPNYLILNHFFDEAEDPVPHTDGSEITTDLVLVPCSVDYLRQIPGTAVVQYLVFNEFEQRLSASKTVTCFQKIQLCNIDTPQCSNSIFNVGVFGTLTGQTRLLPQGSGLIGVAIEHHDESTAAFNLHMQGARANADIIVVP